MSKVQTSSGHHTWSSRPIQGETDSAVRAEARLFVALDITIGTAYDARRVGSLYRIGWQNVSRRSGSFFLAVLTMLFPNANRVELARLWRRQQVGPVGLA